ncbi:parathyroid hormone-related protein-like [Platysternon megacephalum]|uniref:Parathyroid hormone-related protein-like n=1 Tax=Platysternon megacephalum TaxID=55544 RepID=A0A4D9DVB1_9SAUR|nr:parathyroid hormone-related protein-like [Platysternon megacephalum]
MLFSVPSRMVLSLDKWFWWHEYWFPPGFTWEDMKESGSISYPKPRDLLHIVPYALLLVGVRYFFQRFIARPLGRKLGVRDKVRLNAPPNPVLETFYATHSKKPKEGQLISLSKQCDLPTGKVERWFRYRRNQDKPSLTTKFCSVSWSSLCYLISFCTGLVVLYDKPWFWDPRECWVGYPQQPLQRSMYWYYMMELSFALSLTFTMAFDVKRKDFKEQMVHHATTIILISYSYCANYLRIGSLVMLLHVSSTVLLEVANQVASLLELETRKPPSLLNFLVHFPCYSAHRFPMQEPIVEEVAGGVPLLSTSVLAVGAELEISSLVASGVDFVTGSLPENLGENWNLGLTPADPGRDDHLPTDPSLGAKLILMPPPPFSFCT